MERIVNGYYADPNSTRDIIGITPFQFETIVAALQNLNKTMELLLSATPEMRKEFMSSNGSMDMLGIDNIDLDQQELVLKQMEQVHVSMYNESYEILKAINQPYPGAE